ncbi:MAG: hypothetical protein IH988_00935 [Planctomycetes bacterium]|nr:hypothetical protein [Planctomycetota bacterium]
MGVNARWDEGAVATFFVVGAISLAAPVQAELIDDFNDGNDDGWSHFDGFEGTPWGPTIYDASSGQYVISSTQPLPPLRQPVVTGTFWTESIGDPSFSTGFWTTMIRADNAATNLASAMRFDLVNGTGYVFIVDITQDTIGIVRVDNGSAILLVAGFFKLLPGQDYLLQAGVVGPDLSRGANLSLKIWAVGDPEPIDPQLTASDFSYLVGAFGLFIFSEAGGPGGQLSGRFDNVTFDLTSCPNGCEEVVVDLDIKPGSCPNSFNRNSHGVLPVALVGTDTFDVAQVDISSIQLSRTDGVGGGVTPHEGPPGPHSVFADVATPFEGKEPCDCHELEGDGILDLSMKFITDDMVEALQLDDLPAGDLIQLVVNGTLLDGTPFSASDCIRLVPPGAPPGAMAVGSNLSGVFIDVTPLDETLDGGGFANFERTYWLGTIVTLTAPQTHLGWVFAGWSDNAGFGSLATSDDAGPLPDPSIDIIIVDDQISVEAIYTRPVRGNSL